mgnify:CR=1 FL=1
MFRKINRLIPIFERYECRDFTRFFINNKVYNEVKVQRKIQSPKIPYHKQWESRDFYRKNAK